MVAAESTRLFSALFDAIHDRVKALSPMVSSDRVKQYISELPEITQDLCKMFISLFFSQHPSSMNCCFQSSLAS